MRILLYSHDTFGLGHLRRSRTIAHSLAERFPEAEIAIVTGSPFAGTFNFSDQIIYLQIPPVTKRSDGSYTSLEDGIDLDYTVAARASAIEGFAIDWKPDLLIVDKEPLGFRRELLETLQICRKAGTRTVLGLRDVLDSPDILKAEWERKQVFNYLDDLYDEIWVYGPESFYDPLQELPISDAVKERTVFTGFLDRDHVHGSTEPKDPGFDRYTLVTVGGGGDGYELMSAVIKMVRAHPGSGENFLVVLGPFMATQLGEKIRQQAADLDEVRVIDFDPDLEHYIRNADVVVGMCGYNTFCEVLTFNKRAMFVPRSVPRLEQRIRAYRSASLGWSSVLEISEATNPQVLFQALKSTRTRRLPLDSPTPPDMAGLERICDRVAVLLAGVVPESSNVIRLG